MAFDKFTTICSNVILLDSQNIDTDQIIPARFLKTTSREGFGDYLFYDWRYNTNGEPKRSQFGEIGDSKIIVAGRNFGCGSSREHAAWAIYDYGIRVVISDFFADIFKSNAFNNGLLPIELESGECDRLRSVLRDGGQLCVDLINSKIRSIETGDIFDFSVDSFRRECLLNGFDALDYLLSKYQEISNYEHNNK